MTDQRQRPAWVHLGPDDRVDDDVVLGYLSGRDIAERTLTIGPSAVIRAGTIIYAGTRIGSSFETGHHVVIREENRIGDAVYIWNNSTVDYGCQIGNGVKIHCNCYVAQYTIVEDDVFLAPGVTIANDKYPGFEVPVRLTGPTIRRGAQVGANVTILPGVEIGSGALVGAGSVVTRNVAPGMVVVGNPAKPVQTVAELCAARGVG
jgi:acetyltransferase-like isoleucine patch superfamily enzyme